MSDQTVTPPRPVSLFTIVFLLVLFAAFLLVVRYFYTPATASPQSIVAENYPKEKDAEWRATSESRRKALQDIHAEQAKQLTSYGKKDGKIQLPIERAMELTAQQYGARK
jgi:hypothetical protein